MQQSLFGGVAKVREKSPKWAQHKSKEVVEEFDDEPTGEDEDGTIDTGLVVETTEEAIPWAEECKQNNESLTYMQFDYYTNLASESIRSHCVMERHWRGAEESYGGSWGGGGSWSTSEEVKGLRDELIRWYTHWIEIPYHHAKADEFTLRGIKRENIRLLFSDRAKEFVQRVGGWSVEELQKELESLPEAVLTDEYMAKCDEYQQCSVDETTYNRRYYALRQDIEKAIHGENMLISPELIADKYKELVDCKRKAEYARSRWNQLREEVAHYGC